MSAFGSALTPEAIEALLRAGAATIAAAGPGPDLSGADFALERGHITKEEFDAQEQEAKARTAKLTQALAPQLALFRTRNRALLAFIAQVKPRIDEVVALRPRFSNERDARGLSPSFMAALATDLQRDLAALVNGKPLIHDPLWVIARLPELLDTFTDAVLDSVRTRH